MNYIRTNSLEQSYSFKRRSFDYESENSVPHSASSVKCVEGFQETEQLQKPNWKCFSFEEIYNATNGFSSDLDSSPLDWVSRLSVKKGYKRGSREEEAKDASDTDDDDDDEDNADEDDDDDEDDANDEDFSGDEGEEADPEDDAEVNGGGESDDDDDDDGDDDDDDDGDDDNDDGDDDEDEEDDEDVHQPPSKKRK